MKNPTGFEAPAKRAQINRPRIMVLVGLAVVALGVLPTQAAADITGISVSPSPVIAGIPATITVEGTGLCSQVHLDWGDGSTEAPRGLLTLPRTFQHTYRLPPGPRTIVAKGLTRGQCENEVSATVTVEPGRITQLFVGPNPVIAGDSVLIQVRGEGDCGHLRVSFGDGLSTDLRDIQDWPQPIQRPYAPAAVGVKSIKAEGLRDCSGVASVALSVAPRPGYTPPPEGAQGRPRIDAVQGTVTPGGNILVMGSWFGETPASVVVSGSELPPGGLKLTIIEWHDWYVLGTIPWITGVKDQNADVKLLTAGYSGPWGWEPPAWSNFYLVSFKAAREVIKLPVKDLQVTRCDKSASVGPYSDCYLYADDVWGAFHAGGWLGASGQDHYTVPALANGWVVDDLLVDTERSDAWLVVLSKPSSSGAIKLSWNTLPMGAIGYTLSVTIVGPKGVPYR